MAVARQALRDDISIDQVAAMTFPSIRLRERRTGLSVPVALVVVRLSFRNAGTQGQCGAGSGDRAPESGSFLSTHNTSAFSGGFMYKPTTSRTFSTKRGSRLNLNVSTRCGCSRCAFQIRWTVVSLTPCASAIKRVLQWVACGGFVRSVACTMSSFLLGADCPFSAHCGEHLPECLPDRFPDTALAISEPNFSSFRGRGPVAPWRYPRPLQARYQSEISPSAACSRF